MRFSPELRALDWLVARPIAHRGLHDQKAGIIENSRSAFAAAVERGYAIECDLQISRDGEAIVFHDERLERLTGAQGKVRDKTAAEMQRTPLLGTSDTPQTLAELLAQVMGRVPLVIELKTHWDGSDALARRALEVLAPYAGPYCLMSFDADIVEALRLLSPRTVRGIVADRAFDPDYAILPIARRIAMRSLSHAARSQPHFVSFYHRELPWEPVSRFRAAGGPVITWTIKTAAQAARACRYADQITFEGYLP
jgi:glycerophosphoryl diester phosphodiesterase